MKTELLAADEGPLLHPNTRWVRVEDGPKRWIVPTPREVLDDLGEDGACSRAEAIIRVGEGHSP